MDAVLVDRFDRDDRTFEERVIFIAVPPLLAVQDTICGGREIHPRQNSEYKFIQLYYTRLNAHNARWRMNIDRICMNPRRFRWTYKET